MVITMIVMIVVMMLVMIVAGQHEMANFAIPRLQQASPMIQLGSKPYYRPQTHQVYAG